jgi:hypothetical protein
MRWFVYCLLAMIWLVGALFVLDGGCPLVSSS